MVRCVAGTDNLELQRVAFLAKVGIERERSLDFVRAHECEGGGVHQTQLSGVPAHHLVERPFVYCFIHPEHIQKRREGLSEDPHRPGARIPVLEEGIRLHEYVGARDQRGPLSPKPSESLPGLRLRAALNLPCS